jgi:hypothetical protein
MLVASGGQAAAREASRKVANVDIEAACVFHEITKHSYTSVRSVPHYLDWNNRPMAYKNYPAAGAVALPRDLTLLSVFPVASLLLYGRRSATTIYSTNP